MSSKRNEELATAILKNKPKPNRLIVDQSPKDDTSIVPVDKGDTFTVNAAMRSVEFKTLAVAARQRSAATAHRQKTATARRLSTLQLTELNEQSPSEQYREVLREMQLSTSRLLNDAGKPVYGFNFKFELRSVNPFSTTHKDRNKRITKERASMHNSLNDTPYENGLFEFDMFFPSNYPQQPPKCSFLTTGAGKVRFNSNLYTDGTICLSILGTWEGRPEEKWNPLWSLLQVLISIQGLIFVRHPYFNEPGFEKLQGTPKGDDLSRKYNFHIENATLNYAIYEQWQNGPPYFALSNVIRRHFWLKGHALIRQAERWLKEVTENVRNSGHSLLPNVDGIADGVLSSQSLQRQTVRKLVEQFRDMESAKTSQSHRYFACVGVVSMRRLQNLMPSSTGASPVNGAVQSQAKGVNSQTNLKTRERASMHNSLNDTPYENGLFEFDMFFPSNYPQQPPKCSFLTTGAGKVRFNSNLYTDGTICLSILGTWEGRPEEKWNPLCVFKRIATRKQLIALTELRARRAHQALLQTFASAQFTN